MIEKISSIRLAEYKYDKKYIRRMFSICSIRLISPIDWNRNLIYEVFSVTAAVTRLEKYTVSALILRMRKDFQNRKSKTLGLRH